MKKFFNAVAVFCLVDYQGTHYIQEENSTLVMCSRRSSLVLCRFVGDADGDEIPSRFFMEGFEKFYPHLKVG